MATKVTIGGDRLGSGKKMQATLPGFQRSTHDLSFTWKNTQSPGTLVPFMAKLGMPGDTFDIELDCNVKTHPTIGPLFDTFKVQLDIFKADWRLYVGKLHNNKLRGGQEISLIKLPLMTLYAFKETNEADDLSTSQIDPSCLLSYFNIKGVGYVDDSAASTAFARDFTALKLLGYWDIYKNYYANKQELEGAVIHNTRTPINNSVDDIEILSPPSYTPVTVPESPLMGGVYVTTGSLIRLNYTAPALPPIPASIMLYINGSWQNLQDWFMGYSDTGTYVQMVWNGPSGSTAIESWRYIEASDQVGGEPQVVRFPLSSIDTMRERILEAATVATPFNINDQSLLPYSYLINNSVPVTSYDLNYTNQEGLAIKTYQNDLLNVWLRTEDIVGPGSISDISSIDILPSGILTMDQLNIQQKVYNLLTKVVLAGNTYDDYISAVYDHRSFSKPEIPVYCGGLSKELVFQEVISNAETSDQPLGTLGGRGVMSNKHKGGKLHIKCDEFCYLIGIISITPRVVYSQGNEWDNHLLTIDDVHKPDLDGIGYQRLSTEQMAWWDTQTTTGTWSGKTAGFQPAWLNYQTDINRSYGNFALPNNEMFMTLNRKYEFDTLALNIKDLTTYIDPAKYNSNFAQTSRDAMNFWVQVLAKITARRKMSANQIPNL